MILPVIKNVESLALKQLIHGYELIAALRVALKFFLLLKQLSLFVNLVNSIYAIS